LHRAGIAGVESCTSIGPLPRTPCNILRDGPSTSYLRSPCGDIFFSRFIRFTRFTRFYSHISPRKSTRLLVYSNPRILALGNYSFTRYSYTSPWRILVYSYTHMLAYSPWGMTRLLVTRIFLLGGYSFTRILVYSHARTLACSHTRPSETLVCSFARLLACSFTRILAYWFARYWHLSLGGLSVLLVCLLRVSQPPDDYI
jgi:hypothetical protein